jgi:hypothetical protein
MQGASHMEREYTEAEMAAFGVTNKQIVSREDRKPTTSVSALPNLAAEAASKPFGSVDKDTLLSVLSVKSIRAKEMEPENYLFINDNGGGILSTIDCGQIFGETGTGKTLFAMGVAVSVAAGRNFMHWKCVKPRKVIYFDGELAETTIKDRLDLAFTSLSAGERSIAESNMVVFNRDTAFNELGVELAPLDSLQGRLQVEYLVDAIGADMAVFDSRFCLLAADMKETDSMPQELILSMRRRRCLSAWVHHSGKDVTRGGYGDKSAEFLMDFNLELSLTDMDSHLGMTWRKKRKRDEHNGDLYADLTIQYKDGEWHKNGYAPEKTRKKPTTVSTEEIVSKAMVELNIAKQNATGDMCMHDITRDQLRGYLSDNGYFELEDGKFPRSASLLVNKAITNLIAQGHLKGNKTSIKILKRDA